MVRSNMLMRIRSDAYYNSVESLCHGPVGRFRFVLFSTICYRLHSRLGFAVGVALSDIVMGTGRVSIWGDMA
jgi:hypothetical protein